MPVPLADLSPAPAESAGQLWLASEIGGDMAHISPQLSDKLRRGTRKRARYRQFCDLPTSKDVVKGEGSTFEWTVVNPLETRGRRITEIEDVPKTRGSVEKHSVTVVEWANSVPVSRFLMDMAGPQVELIVKKELEADCALTLDEGAYDEYVKTPIKVGPQGGNSIDSIDVNTAGVAPSVNNGAATLAHVRAIVRHMSGRNVPTYDHGDYYAIGGVNFFATIDEQLEQKNQYTETGLAAIREGERGRYGGVRFVHQTNIDGTALFAANDASEEAFFFGEDPVCEALHTEEEVQTAIPTGLGRNRLLAWYYIGEFALTYPTAQHAHVYHWTSLAA